MWFSFRSRDQRIISSNVVDTWLHVVIAVVSLFLGLRDGETDRLDSYKPRNGDLETAIHFGRDELNRLATAAIFLRGRTDPGLIRHAPRSAENFRAQRAAARRSWLR
jgi:hypothetical protein